MKLKSQMKKLAIAVAATSAITIGSVAQAADTIKVGILHSLSGTMAISETTLKDTMLMLIEEQNKKGGLLVKNSSRLSLTQPRIGHYSLRKPAN